MFLNEYVVRMIRNGAEGLERIGACINLFLQTYVEIELSDKFNHEKKCIEFL